jgi:hypothetical protein
MAAITSAVVGVAGTVYSSRQASRQARDQQRLAEEANRQAAEQAQQQTELGERAIAAADPYAAHRGAAAERLNALMNDPSSIRNTASYKARMQAVQRQLASQGYTGSGNALVEAAEAAGTAYQQEFDNLALLSGAGATPGGGYGTAMSGISNAQGNVLNSQANALSARQQGDAQRLSGTVGIVNSLTNLASSFNRPASNTRVNIPVQPITRTRMPTPRLGG